MHQQRVDEISRALLASAAAAALPGKPDGEWDGRAWRWAWTAQSEPLPGALTLGAVTIEVAPDLSRSQAPLSLEDSDFRLAASAWVPGREGREWSRTYLMGQLWML